MVTLTSRELRELAQVADYAGRMGRQTAGQVRAFCEGEGGDPWENAAGLLHGAVGELRRALAMLGVEVER